MLLLQVLFFSLFFVRGICSDIEVVPCNHNTSVCECMDPDKEACEFTLDVEMLQTFTRYLLDDDKDSRGTAGSVWHINNGEWEPVDYDPSMNSNTLCGSSI